MEVYLGHDVSEATTSQGNATKRRKASNVPKKPLSGYNIFFSEQHALMRGSGDGEASSAISYKNVTAEIAKRWAALPSEEKQRLEQRAEENHRLQTFAAVRRAAKECCGNS